MTRVRTEAAKTSIETQKWKGKLISNRLNDQIFGPHCFDWFTSWKDCPTEVYQILVPTKVCYRDKLRYQIGSTICRLCEEQPESVAHILAACPALAQNNYTDRQNAGLKCLYFTRLKHYDLINRIPPWHSAIVPKPEVKNTTYTAECRIQTT